MRGWGATAEERTEPLPGDEDVPEPGAQSTRAVTTDAPAERVWPLENLAGCRMRNADRIHPEWQHRDQGEKVMLHSMVGLEVGRFEPGRALVLRDWGAFVLEPAGDDRTRLLIRGRVPAKLPALVYYNLLIELPHFIMERKMLLGIKRQTEGPEGERP